MGPTLDARNLWVRHPGVAAQRHRHDLGVGDGREVMDGFECPRAQVSLLMRSSRATVGQVQSWVVLTALDSRGQGHSALPTIRGRVLLSSGLPSQSQEAR